MENILTLKFPFQTGGGPSNPTKGPNSFTNMQSFWNVELVHGSTMDSLVHLQGHKAWYNIMRVEMLIGGDSRKAAIETRKNQGDMNLDPYRIIIAHGPQYAAIATSEDFDLLSEDYAKLLRKSEEMLHASGGNRAAAADLLLNWVIQQKVRSAVEDGELDLVLFELRNLQSIPPVALANLEREHYETWQNPDTPPKEHRKAELMTWACSWEMEEVVRKFKDRRKGDQWGVLGGGGAASLRAVPNSAQSPKSTISSEPSATSLQDAEQHAVYGIFFRMLRNGIPRGAVEQKMRLQHLDVVALDNPSRLEQYGSDRAAVPFISTVQLKKVEGNNHNNSSSSSTSRSTGPFQNAIVEEMKRKLALRRAAVQDDDDDEFSS